VQALTAPMGSSVYLLLHHCPAAQGDLEWQVQAFHNEVQRTLPACITGQPCTFASVVNHYRSTVSVESGVGVGWGWMGWRVGAASRVVCWVRRPALAGTYLVV
jgi:hypothetical protein